MRCPHCGKEHPDTAKFCDQTGQKLEQYCTNPDCDFRDPLPTTANFCPNCGRPLTKENQFHEVNHKSQIAETQNIYVDCDRMDSYHFDGKHIIIEKNGFKGLISVNGRILLPCEYRDILPVSENLRAVETASYDWLFLDKSFNVVMELPEGLWVASSIGFCDGLCSVIKHEDGESTYGYIDRNFRLVIDCQFSYVDDFEGGVASVTYDEGFSSENKFFIDKNGDRIYEDYFNLKIENGYLIYEEYGTRDIIIRKLSTGEEIPMGKSKRNKFGIGWIHISKDGLCVYRKEDRITWFNFNNSDKRKSYQIASHGVWFETFSDGLLGIHSPDNKYGFINHNREIVIPFEYEDAHSFSEGLAPIAKNGKWGVIDTNNDLVIDIMYDEICDFKNNYAVAKLNDKYMVIDRSGNVVLSSKG